MDDHTRRGTRTATRDSMVTASLQSTMILLCMLAIVLVLATAVHPQSVHSALPLLFS